MSWISDFAGKAEDLLNRIDNNAASVLHGKEKKRRPTAREDGNLQSVITSDCNAPSQVLSETSFLSHNGATTPVNLTPKKTAENVSIPIVRQSNAVSRDEELIKYLNNSSVDVESIEKEKEDLLVATSPKKFPLVDSSMSNIQTENEMLRNEVRSLNAEISLLLGRVKSAEGENKSSKALLTKKEVEIKNLKQEMQNLKLQFQEVQKTNENGFLENERLKMNLKPRSELCRDMEEKISDLQLEMHKREEQFKGDLANMRIRVTEMEELLLAAKSDHIKEMNSSKIRLEELRNEFEDYKTRARKSLADKEALIQEYKSVNQASPAAESMEISQLRQELEILSSELEKCEERIEIERKRTEEAVVKLDIIREEFGAEILSVRTSLRQETERRLAAEENCRLCSEELHKEREELTKQLALMSERFREKVNEVATLRRQITQRGDVKSSMADAKVSTLTQALVQKQASLESITNERNQLRLELERFKNSYGQYVTHLNTRGNVNDTDDAKAQVPNFMLETPFDTGVARKMKRAYSSLDAVSIRTGMFLRRYPLARTFVLCYVICLHLWVCLVLFSNTPDSKI